MNRANKNILLVRQWDNQKVLETYYFFFSQKKNTNIKLYLAGLKVLNVTRNLAAYIFMIFD